MRNKGILLLSLIVLLLKLSEPGHAAGIGVYGSAGGGSMLYKEPPESLHNFEAISGTSFFGFGFAAGSSDFAGL